MKPLDLTTLIQAVGVLFVALTSLISAIGGTIAAIQSFRNGANSRRQAQVTSDKLDGVAAKQERLKENIDLVHENVNSKMDAMLALTASSNLATGRKQVEDEQKVERGL